MSLNNNKSDTKNALYGLIISQLLHDGHQDIACMLQKKEGMKKFSLPSDKLLDIVDIHFKNSPEDHFSEDELISKYRDEVRADVYEKFNSKVDRDMMVSIILEQIKLVGSKKLYEKVSKFYTGQTYFIQEQMKLYQWREQFFYKNFPDDSWYTDGGSDAHCLDTVPYQITRKFDKIVALACTPIRPSRLYFEHHEGLSSEARDSFDWLKDRLILYRYDNPGEALVVIASLYQIGKHSSY